MDTSLVETDACLKVVDAMLKAARTSLKPNNPQVRMTTPSLRAISLPLESTAADLLALEPERETAKSPTLDAMLKAARTSLKPNNPQVRMTTPSLRAISLPLESTVTDLLALEPEREANPSPVLEVIKRRRSIGQMLPDLPDRAQIEKMLEAATYAPSHHVTEPWHFWVLTGEGRERFGAVLEESLRQRLGACLDEKSQKQLLNERKKPLRAPVIITVALRGISHPAGDALENIEAAAAAVQNMLLIAEEMGLATIWRTGDPACDPLVKAWFGLSASDPIIGFVYVGYPKIARAMRVPTHFSTKTTWVQ